MFNKSKGLGTALVAALVSGVEFVKDKAKGAAMAVVGAVGVATAALPAPAHAALTLDSTGILADIATAAAFITTVGLAVLGMVFVAKAIKYARRAG